jgi:selenocysteine lyase/cysteine desulfurase
MIDVTALRATEFPWTANTVYLDAASIGPLPERSRRALDAFNMKRCTPHVMTKAEQFGALDRGRELVAKLLNAQVSEIALVTNTSFGINIAARGLPLGSGDVVIASDREFPANVYPWMKLADQGVEFELAPCTPEGWPDEAYLLARIMDPRVKVLAVSLVQFSSGYKVDLERLSQATRETGTWLVVDAIQGLGHVPLDLSRVEVDILASGAQKWLLSPWGTGFMYVRQAVLDRLRPPFAGWLAFRGTDDFSRLTQYDPTWHPDSRRFEMVTLPYQDFAAMNASLGLLLEVGIEIVAKYLATLPDPLFDLAGRRGYAVTSPRGAQSTPITCIKVPEASLVHAQLRKEGVICSLREGSLRFAPHVYNNMDDMIRAAEMVEVLSPRSHTTA